MTTPPTDHAPEALRQKIYTIAVDATYSRAVRVQRVGSKTIHFPLEGRSCGDYTAIVVAM
jgi:hypothetical protein